MEQDLEGSPRKVVWLRLLDWGDRKAEWYLVGTRPPGIRPRGRPRLQYADYMEQILQNHCP